MASQELHLGAVVDVTAGNGGRGTVRFYGVTSFAAGKWVGVELNEPKGKNDGTVQGVRYFTCKMNYGVFARPSQVRVIKVTPEPRPAPGATRPPLGHQRTSSSSRGHSSQPSRDGSPVKPPPITVHSSPGASRARLESPPRRTPSAPGASRTVSRRQSLLSEATSPTVSRQRSFDSPTQEHGSRSAGGSSVHAPSPHTSSPRPPSTHAPSPLNSTPLQPSSLRRVSTPPPPPEPEPEPQPPQVDELDLVVPALPPPPDDSELQELRARVRVLEAKRADDARHVRELETRLGEAETFVALRPKLQAKLNSLQTELIATKRELADSQQISQLHDNRIADSHEQLEMAMLDKEMAEERAEAAEAELEEVKERLAIIEVELQHLRDDGGLEGGGEAVVKQSLPYVQLEKQNERLKEALIRLRDLSQETEQEQRQRIAELEKDINGVEELRSEYESVMIKLTNAEVQVEDLKLQLDDALGAEEMLVQLTERNLMLGEKIEEMRITIEDLEALKELNDELEENHIETEKALQDDIDTKDNEIREQARKIQTLEDACQDLEGTIVQFRELVLQLQTELDNLRAETQTAQHESAAAASQHAAMMSLNLKLQSSATKNQARAIELELRRIEAREAKELLSIVQPYLPQLYVESDTDATSCYLLFQRLAAKIDIINTFIAQAQNLPEALNGDVTEMLVGICEMRGRLSTLSITCQRFAAILRRCDVESFLSIGRIFPDISPMEKRIDMHLDLLRREEFRVYECVSDAAKMQSQFDHLAETHFNGFEFDLGERELGYALSFDYDLEMFSASVGLIKTSISAVMKEDDQEVDLGGLDREEDFFAPLQKLLDQCRGVKVLTKKLARRMEDLTQESTALKAPLLSQLQALNNDVPELVNFGFSLAQRVMPYLTEVRASKSAFQLTTVLSYVKDCASSSVGKDNKDGPASWEAVAAFFGKVVEDLNKLIVVASEHENIFKITGTAPWVIRIDEIKSATAINVEAERKVAQLNDEMQALVRTLKAKDQHIQEAGVKIELMERRMETVKKQADAIADLETELQKSRKQEKAYEEAMEQLQADLDAFEQENAKLKQAVSSTEKQAPAGAPAAEPESVQVEGSLETSYLLEQIDALRGTVRFLRTENSYLKGQDLLREIETLPHLPEPVSREPTPPLIPSGSSDSSDSEFDDPLAAISLRTLAVESKLLFRDVIKYASSPRMVDLSVTRSTVEGSDRFIRPWMPKKKTPAYQIWERKLEGERLGRRVKGFLERTNIVATRSS